METGRGERYSKYVHNSFPLLQQKTSVSLRYLSVGAEILLNIQLQRQIRIGIGEEREEDRKSLKQLSI